MNAAGENFQELLALEERIGNVSTGLIEETILKCLKQTKYVSVAGAADGEVEPCCICQVGPAPLQEHFYFSCSCL